MIAIIESVGGLLVAAHHARLRSRWLIKLALKRDERFIPGALRQNGPVILMGRETMRWVRLLASVAQLPVIQQCPTSLSYRLNLWKLLISDGLLTEYFVDRLGIRPNVFYSMRLTEAEIAPMTDATAIIGSNWLEFGSMSEASYIAHLSFLRARYPAATYYCHPKEVNALPETIFGKTRVVRPDMPVELLLRKTGVARRLVGVCSTSLLGIATTWPDIVVVDLVDLAPEWFDGPTGDIVEVMSPPVQGVSRVSVADLQSYLLEILGGHGATVNLVTQVHP